MDLKEINPINFLFFNTRSKISDLGRFVGIIARELYRDAALNDLEIAGPIYWNYKDFTGNPQDEFGLEIALPVVEIPEHYVGKFQVKRTEPFYCVSVRQEGSWLDIPAAYEKITTFIRVRGMKMTSCNREIYIHMDFENPAANITEVQVGVSKQSYRNAIQRKSMSIQMVGYGKTLF